MQLKCDSATTYLNIVKKIVLQRKYPTLCMISLYVNQFLTSKIIFHFPKKNNFMLVTPRTEMYEGVLHI